MEPAEGGRREERSKGGEKEEEAGGEGGGGLREKRSRTTGVQEGGVVHRMSRCPHCASSQAPSTARERWWRRQETSS